MGCPRSFKSNSKSQCRKKENRYVLVEDQEARNFEVGDLAVYPAHGVGKIEAIESRVVNGETHDFYIMKVLENSMVIMIPTWNVVQVGLRDVINEKEVPKIYEVLESKKDSGNESQTWNRRYREYMDKIKTGSLYDVAEVFRDLSLLKMNKDLSFGERKLYDTAQVLLVKELSTAKSTDEETIMSEIESFFICEEDMMDPLVHQELRN
ncbi:MAG: CarD family transcriptional regulator [Desulfobacterales bacterium]|nr:CarD family transcriptional regulator [Desulfobacterales bacterium]